MDVNQTGNYNCQNASDSAYGAGGYGTCAESSAATATSTTQPGAPNTGSFIGFITSGSFSIILPLLLALVVAVAATVVVARKKRAAHKQ